MPRVLDDAAPRRSDAAAGPAPARPARTRPARPRRAGWVAGGLAVAVLLASAVGYGLLRWGDGQIARIDVFGGLHNRPARADGGAVTYLVVGSDTREGLSARDLQRLRVGSVASAAGRRSDTMLLVHVSKQRRDVTVVSLPRDSWVDVPGHGKDKLNAAYSLGGPTLAVQAVEQATGVRVDHYVEINFAGFADMVDALGGVEICTPRPIDDEKAHLRLAAGRHTLDGVESLKYVRAREFDRRADVGRMERQQQFLGAMMREATGRGVLLNPVKLTRFVDAALGSVHTDPGLDRRAVIDLAARLRGLSPGKVTFLTVPLADPSFRPGGGVGAVALWDDDAARTLFANLRADRRATAPRRAGRPTATPTPDAPLPTVPAGDVRLRVLNGAGAPGLGARAADDLRRAGFAVAGRAGNADTSGAVQTVVRYDPRWSDSLRTVRAALPDAEAEPVDGLGRTFQVVVGSSYAGVAGLPSPSGTPSPDASRSGSATPGAPGSAPVKVHTAADNNPCG